MNDDLIGLFSEKPSFPKELLTKWKGLISIITRMFPGSIVWMNGFDQSFISFDEMTIQEINIKYGELCQSIQKTGKKTMVTDPKPGIKTFFGFPILWPDQTIFGSLCLVDRSKDLFNEPTVRILQDFADQFSSDVDLFYHQSQLKTQVGERKKELNLLYFLTEISFMPGLRVEDILQETVHKIPTGWQYPDITCAKIILDDLSYQTENFKETPWVQIADILTNGKKNGMVAVYYLQEKPEADEGPFLKEERDLINGIVRLLNFTIKEKKTNEELKNQKTFDDLVMNSIPGLFFVLDPTYHFVRWNHKLQNTTGLTAEELKNSSFLEIIDEEDKEAFKSIIQKRQEKAMIETEARIFNIQNQHFEDYSFQLATVWIGDRFYLIGTGNLLEDLKQIG